MSRLILENITTEQAKVLADWYEGQGEQDASIWCDENGVETPYSDVGRKGGCKVIHENGDVTLYCK